ncbi:Hypothetical predicted protein, partial [Mytilus galloprovincialis]
LTLPPTTTRENNVSWFTTLLSPTIELNTTFMISLRRLTSPTIEPKLNDLGLNNREIIVYSICAGTLVFFVLMCSLSQHRYQKIYWRFKRYQTSNRRRTENQQQGIPLEEIEGIYEVIDESNMIYNLGDLRNDNMSVPGTNGSYVQPDSNDYLTPYHPVDEDAKTNNSKDNESESTASSDSYNRPTSNHESSSSSSDVQGRRSSYLNPYQPIVQSVDIHEYLSIDNIDDSVSSGSIEQTSESGYLNPVQSVIPVSNLLDNKCVIGCSE